MTRTLTAISMLLAFSSLQGPVESLAEYLGRLGLGSKVSVIVVFSVEDADSLKQIEFYRRLLAVPGMDGKVGRFIMFTRDGVVPAIEAMKAKNVQAHITGSYPVDPGGLPSALGSVAMLNPAGAILKSWNGYPSASQQEEVRRFLETALR